MTASQLKELVQEVVDEARRLNAKHTDQYDAPVNYACIFSHSDDEYEALVASAKNIGQIVDCTPTGPIFYTKPIPTAVNPVLILKVRRPDPKRPEKGDADFTVGNFENFKRRYLGKPGFKLIKRKNMEMVELSDPDFDVLAYYSHPTVAELLGIDLSY